MFIEIARMLFGDFIREVTTSTAVLSVSPQLVSRPSENSVLAILSADCSGGLSSTKIWFRADERRRQRIMRWKSMRCVRVAATCWEFNGQTVVRDAIAANDFFRLCSNYCFCHKVSFCFSPWARDNLTNNRKLISTDCFESFDKPMFAWNPFSDYSLDWTHSTSV